MSDKIKALSLVLLLALSIEIGKYWADDALNFVVHVAFVLVLEILVSFAVSNRWRRPKD